MISVAGHFDLRMIRSLEMHSDTKANIGAGGNCEAVTQPGQPRYGLAKQATASQD